MFTAVTIQDANGTDIALFDGNRRLGQSQGLHGLPAPRRIVRTRPGGHGEINTTKHYGSRQPVWNGHLTGANATALWAEYDAILEALWGCVEETRLMKWEREDGLALQTSVKLADSLSPPISATDAGRFLPYQLMFDREDPRNYSQTLRVAMGGALTTGGGGFGFPFGFPFSFAGSSSGGSTIVVNAGTIDTPATFTIHGQIANPQIQHVETGRVIVLNGELSAGSTLVIDGHERTVMLDGITDRGNLINAPATDWRTALVPAGGGTYRLFGTSWGAGARLDVSTRDAYA